MSGREIVVLSRPDTLPVRDDTPFSVFLMEQVPGVRGSHEVWMTPDEADRLADVLKAAAQRARRKQWDR